MMIRLMCQLRSVLVVALVVAGGQHEYAYAIQPFSTFQDFPVGSNGAVVMEVPTNMLWVVESISGRVGPPTGRQITNFVIFQQNGNNVASSVFYAEPKLLAKNVVLGGPAQDIYTFNSATRLYYTGSIATNVATDSFDLPTQVSVSMNGYLIPALNGDFNGNGAVDAADYIVYRNSVGRSGIGLAADGNDNNLVEAGDLSVWRARYGNTTAASGSSVGGAAVPEPASWIGLGIGSMLIACASMLRRSRAVFRLYGLAAEQIAAESDDEMNHAVLTSGRTANTSLALSGSMSSALTTTT